MKKKLFVSDSRRGRRIISELSLIHILLGEQGYHVASVVGGYEAMKKISKNYFKNRENM